MEEDKKQILQGGCPRKLNFNAPLLSIRRPVAVTNDKLLQETFNPTSINMVPFSWERIPGEPKDRATNNTTGNNDEQPLPLPKLPPGRWEPPATKEAASAIDQFCDYDDGCDGDVDNDDDDHHNEGKNNGCFSDVIDIFSLAESMDDYEANCKTSTTDEPDAYQSPNFIIQRFLLDAQALAAASVAHKKLPFSTSPNSSASFSRAVSVRSSYPSVKGCGLGSFFHWRMKPKLCSVKRPVHDSSIRLVNLQWDIGKEQNRRYE